MSITRSSFVLLCVALLGKPAQSTTQGEPVVYFPPFELRPVAAEKTPFVPRNPVNSFSHHGHHHNQGFEPHQQSNQVPVQSFQQFFHPNAIETMETKPIRPQVDEMPAPHILHKRPDRPEIHTKNSTVNVQALLNALGLNEDNQVKEDEHERAASGKDYDYPDYHSHHDSYRPQHDYWAPPHYHHHSDRPYAYLPPTYAHHSAPSTQPLSLLKEIPDLKSLVKPVASKVANKFGGLLGVGLELLTGSTANDVELKGLKDIVVNGVIRPLMAAKGGIKSLISKLSIPVIVLLLMNVEVLVLIWWLWEDCPNPPEVHPYRHPVSPYHDPYSPPRPYNYNSYR